MIETTKSSLAGKKILITRPLFQQSHLIELLHERLAQTESIPLLTISYPEDWSKFDQIFQNNKEENTTYEWLIFASTNAVHSALSRCKIINSNILQNIKIACIGKTTSTVLESYGLSTHFIPKNFIAESFVETFPKPEQNISNKLIWLRGNKGRLIIKDELEKKGWKVEIIEIYKSQSPENLTEIGEKIYKLITNFNLDIITLTSSETAHCLANSLLAYKESLDSPGDSKSPTNNNEYLAKLIKSVKLAVIGPETARSTINLFGKVDIEAKIYTVEGLVKAMENYFDQNKALI